MILPQNNFTYYFLVNLDTFGYINATDRLEESAINTFIKQKNSNWSIINNVPISTDILQNEGRSNNTRYYQQNFENKVLIMYKKIDNTSEEIRKVRQNLFTLTVNLRTKFPNINFNLGKEIKQIKFTSTIPNSLDTYNLNLLVLPLVKN